MAYPTTLSNYTGNETLFVAGHSDNHNQLEAKVGIGASIPTSGLVLTGGVTAGTSAWTALPTYNIPVKATGAEINTGTDDAKYTTAKAIADSDIAFISDITVTPTSTNTLTNKTQVSRTAAYTPAGAGTTTIDLSTGGVHIVTMPAATQTIAISNDTTGQCFMVEINNVTSQGTLTWFTTIKWAGGSAPTLTGTNGKKDTFGFRVTGTGTYDGYIVGQNI